MDLHIPNYFDQSKKIPNHLNNCFYEFRNVGAQKLQILKMVGAEQILTINVEDFGKVGVKKIKAYLGGAEKWVLKILKRDQHLGISISL